MESTPISINEDAAKFWEERNKSWNHEARRLVRAPRTAPLAGEVIRLVAADDQETDLATGEN
jgi:hypothetical protein